MTFELIDRGCSILDDLEVVNTFISIVPPVTGLSNKLVGDLKGYGSSRLECNQLEGTVVSLSAHLENCDVWLAGHHILPF